MAAHPSFIMNNQQPHTAPEDFPSHALVVEDDADVLHFLSELLTTIGIRPTSARDGREAMEKLKAERFPLVFTDMNMPQVDGMQLISHIRDHYPGTDVIAMTGYSQDYDLVDVIRAGATDYMTKPFTMAEFQAKIRRVTRERALLHALQQELTSRRSTENKLNRLKDSLLQQVQQQKEEVQETNAALRIILRQRDMEKTELANSHAHRFFKEIAPYLDLLKQSNLQESQRYYLEMVTLHLENIFTPLSQRKTLSHKPFTDTEIKVINLMKQKKTSKEIANLLQVSTGTIRTHRENIRKKLQITNTKKNLYRTILSLP